MQEKEKNLIYATIQTRNKELIRFSLYHELSLSLFWQVF